MFFVGQKVHTCTQIELLRGPVTLYTLWWSLILFNWNGELFFFSIEIFSGATVEVQIRTNGNDIKLLKEAYQDPLYSCSTLIICTLNKYFTKCTKFSLVLLQYQHTFCHQQEQTEPNVSHESHGKPKKKNELLVGTLLIDQFDLWPWF